MFDFERKKFWKMRFTSLFGSIMRHNRRRLKATLLVGFHKFALKSLLIRKYWKPNTTMSFMGVPETDQFSRFESQRSGETASFMKSRRALPHDKSPKQGQSPRDKSPITKSPISKGSQRNKLGKGKHERQPSINSMNQAILKEQEAIMHKHMQKIVSDKLKKLQAVGIIFLIAMKRDLADIQAVARALFRWNKVCSGYERQSLNEELQSMNFILNERVFRENLFRTKIKLQKSEIESKLATIQELISIISTHFRIPQVQE